MTDDRDQQYWQAHGCHIAVFRERIGKGRSYRYVAQVRRGDGSGVENDFARFTAAMAWANCRARQFAQQGGAGLGAAWPGTARRGRAGRGAARQGLARLG